jgi:TPR repeat protein
MSSANQIQNVSGSTVLHRSIRRFAALAGGSSVLLFTLIGIGCKPATKSPATEAATPKSSLEELLAKAEKGDVEAQFKLGVVYESGKGVPQNFAESIKWTRKAAEQGYAKAQIHLGDCYAVGKGVPKDHSEEKKWYHKAAEQGDADGQAMLAMRCYFSLNEPRDLVEAYKWACLAAAHTTTDAKNDKFGADFRDSLLKDMTPDQIAEAQRQAATFIPKKETKPR